MARGFPIALKARNAVRSSAPILGLIKRRKQPKSEEGDPDGFQSFKRDVKRDDDRDVVKASPDVDSVQVQAPRRSKLSQVSFQR